MDGISVLSSGMGRRKVPKLNKLDSQSVQPRTSNKSINNTLYVLASSTYSATVTSLRSKINSTRNLNTNTIYICPAVNCMWRLNAIRVDKESKGAT